MGLRPSAPGDALPQPGAWERLSPRARRAVLLTSIVPPVLTIVVVVPVLVLYLRDPTEPGLAFLVAVLAVTYAITLGLAVRLSRILKRENPASVTKPVGVASFASYALHLLVFAAIYVSAIYVVVFLPVGDSTEGRVALNVVLLAVMAGLPILYYLAARALRRRWQARPRG